MGARPEEGARGESKIESVRSLPWPGPGAARTATKGSRLRCGSWTKSHPPTPGLPIPDPLLSRTSRLQRGCSCHPEHPSCLPSQGPCLFVFGPQLTSHFPLPHPVAGWASGLSLSGILQTPQPRLPFRSSPPSSGVRRPPSHSGHQSCRGGGATSTRTGAWCREWHLDVLPAGRLRSRPWNPAGCLGGPPGDDPRQTAGGGKEDTRCVTVGLPGGQQNLQKPERACRNQIRVCARASLRSH